MPGPIVNNGCCFLKRPDMPSKWTLAGGAMVITAFVLSILSIALVSGSFGKAKMSLSGGYIMQSTAFVINLIGAVIMARTSCVSTKVKSSTPPNTPQQGEAWHAELDED